jgi:SAM-dependent methyltransferase
MLKFSDFDTRGYRTVDVRSGYNEWAATYEDTVQNEMDIALLEQLTLPRWSAMHAVADLGCGTGRSGAWLKSRGVNAIDGVDIAPGMLRLAGEKAVYRRLVESGLEPTPLDGAAYDLVIACLIDEHLADAVVLYREAARLAAARGLLVVVGYHPYFMMASGMPTHYDSDSGEPVAIETHLHLMSDHISAGAGNGWQLVEMRERLIDDKWVALKPKWERFRNCPISFATVWEKRSGSEAGGTPDPTKEATQP